MTIQSEPSGSAPAVILMGSPGAGKSWALTTLVECGLELFVIGTEPRFVDALFDSAAARKIDTKRIHTKMVQPMRSSFKSLIASATFINQLSFESLAQIKGGVGKTDYNQFIVLLQALENFVDDRTGEVFGAVDTWGPERALALDSMSGVNLMAMDLVVGAKPIRAIGEWGVAMENEERLINKLASDLHCPFVLTAHQERERDELTGGTSVQIGMLGQKLAPKMPRLFSEVVHCRRDSSNYFWSTITPFYELKRRVLPLSDKIEPHFRSIINAWRARSKTEKEANNDVA